ncbi:MAG TPA: hypothetical protein VFX82_09010, partial [Desulfobacterales bacterium]|nr:hypothetical protein [Desulfobacterales bacterium]
MGFTVQEFKGFRVQRRKSDDFDQSPQPRRANLAARGVLPVRRNTRGTQRNAGCGLSAKPPDDFDQSPQPRRANLAAR